MQPYDPQKPATPGAFAGRHELIEFVRTSLEVATSVRRGSALLLFGYRGSGKTSALRKVQALVRDAARDSVIVEVPLRFQSSETMLILGIVEAIRRQLASRPRLGSRVRRAVERVSAVSVLGTGIQREPAQHPPPSHPVTLWNDALEAMARVPLLCICIDDAELLDAGHVAILKTMAETDSPVPLLLAVAGGPELMEQLSRPVASPILRVFSGAMFDIGQFSLAETQEALEAPLKSNRRAGRWDTSAVESIYHLTHGYPYLVQCFGAAAYRDGQPIREDDVLTAVPKALRLASSWLERELPNASDQDIRAFVSVASLGRIEFRSSDLTRAGLNPVYTQRLVSAGVLRRVARGRYELRMAPAIAYFHALRRGLTDSTWETRRRSSSEIP